MRCRRRSAFLAAASAAKASSEPGSKPWSNPSPSSCCVGEKRWWRSLSSSSSRGSGVGGGDARFRRLGSCFATLVVRSSHVEARRELIHTVGDEAAYLELILAVRVTTRPPEIVPGWMKVGVDGRFD